jgi:hypothetical protein
MPKYKRVDRRIVRCADDDPEGRERWEVSGKWETKPGRKPGEARTPVNLRLPQEMVDWLREQPAGITGTIEELIDRAKAG